MIEHMRDCKDAVMILASKWKYEDMVIDRKDMLRDYSTREVHVREWPNSLVGNGYRFKATRAEGRSGEMSDWRFWKTESNCLLQWRTGIGKEGWDNHRFVITTFGKEPVVERLPVNKFFSNPLEPTDGEMMMFMMLYPEVIPALAGMKNIGPWIWEWKKRANR
ncbi:hypothetical protein KASHIRA_01720 [Serratia phage vB_SmaM-Kashira]|nr:hypothetical protein KASHIRA_01720 [Serratia phage vB_SmaM-Kashira]